MGRPTVNLLFNSSVVDTPCTNPAGDSNYLLLSTGDYLLWRDEQQISGDLLSGVGYPVVLPESGSSEAPKLFLADYSEGEYTQIALAGSSENGLYGGNNRYVCAAWFSGATNTIPYLEAYDDSTHDTWESRPLGDGTPANSSLVAICTTASAPGLAAWVGTPLAGTDSRVALDVAPISTSKYVYWNMKQVLRSTMSTWDSEDWSNSDLVLTIHFTYS